MREFALTEWERACKALASAKQLAESDPDSAASRAYYAAFHAVTALFALRGQSYSKHSALRAALHRELVQQGVWNTDQGRAFDFLMDIREVGDYGGLSRVNADSARLAVQRAEMIIEAVRAVCPDLDAGS